MPEQPASIRLHDPVLNGSLRSWYQSLASHDAADVAGHLEAIGLVLIVLSKKIEPTTTAPLSEDHFAERLAIWRRCLGDLLGVTEDTK